jgi:hypothetical protein
MPLAETVSAINISNEDNNCQQAIEILRSQEYAQLDEQKQV